MCNYEILVRSAMGFVVRCKHCGALNVVFGNMALSIDQPEFMCFHERICEKVDTHRFNYRPKVREIHVDTPLPSYKMLFSFEELQNLSHLLTKAKIILDARPSVN